MTALGELRPDSSPDPRPRAALHTLGCRLNLAETALLQRRLEAAGYRIVPWGEEAELMVLNSCTVTLQSDAKSRQQLGSMRSRFPGAKLAVVGCYAQIDGQALAERGLADLVLGNGEKMRLAEYLPQLDGRAAPLVANPRIPREPFRLDTDGAAGVTTRAHLKMQDGCDFMCSFCIIPKARGRARPRDWDDLLREAEGLASQGARELVLTGVNLGTYEEGGQTLTDVVDALDALPGLARLRISSIEPTTVDPGLLERMTDPAHKLVPFLHLPLQSGSPRILAAMRRRYTAEEYRAFAEQALARVPDLCLGTDVLAGFPGEDDAAHGETVALLETLPFAYFHVFPYSERPGTPAARMADQVAPRDKQRRVAELRALSDCKRLDFQRRFVGRTLDVLFEQPKSDILAQGYTANYIRVECPIEDPEALRNRILPARLLSEGDEPHPEVVRGMLMSSPPAPLRPSTPLRAGAAGRGAC
jgi:threonylcarbamoyladenosine tRNA methylthiotransferase MtaB